MADIRAFRGYRYDPGRAGAFSDVIAPPYDVIDEALQQKLYDQSPYNIIRLILGKQSAEDTESDNRYTRAGRTAREWVQEDVLTQDTAASIYVHHQELEWEGQRYVRKGFMARTRLEPFGEGCVYPHEETMPGPKADRLKLIQATRMNLSPIFGMYPDEENEIQQILDEHLGQRLPIEATDHLGVVNRLWPVSDQQIISRIQGLMGNKPVFIADGHHRYETGLKYLEEQRKAGAIANEEAPACFTLMMLVGMSDPGLIIHPTHRLFSGFPAIGSEELCGILSNHFEVDVIGKGESGGRETWDLIQADGGQDVLGFGCTGDQTWVLARLKDREKMRELAPEHSAAWCGLTVSVLQVLVIDHLLSQKYDSPYKCEYVHTLNEVFSADSGISLAALVPHATMEHVQEIARSLEKMPPKSTYFYPKLPSGLVISGLAAH